MRIDVETTEEELAAVRRFLSDTRGTYVLAPEDRMVAKAVLSRALSSAAAAPAAPVEVQTSEQGAYREATRRLMRDGVSQVEVAEHFKTCLRELGEQYAALRNENVVVKAEAAALREALECFRPGRQQLSDTSKSAKAFDDAMSTTAGRDFLFRLLEAEQRALGKSEPMLYARCPKHILVPQLNQAEASGGECGACVRDAKTP